MIGRTSLACRCPALRLPPAIRPSPGEGQITGKDFRLWPLHTLTLANFGGASPPVTLGGGIQSRVTIHNFRLDPKATWANERLPFGPIVLVEKKHMLGALARPLRIWRFRPTTGACCLAQG
jgi:hypothetical protein